MNHLHQIVFEEIKESATPDKAEWWNQYLKGEIPFLGVGTPEIRKVFLNRDRELAFENLAMNQQVSLVNGLMRGNYAEEKLAAILYVQLFWLESMKGSFLMNLVSDWFEDRCIYDWNTTDWLCVKVLAYLIDTGDERVIWELKRWNRDPYLWKARASLVPFSQAKRMKEHSKSIAHFSDILIRREERFAKTAVGWVLREYSKLDEAYVLDFFSRHVKYTTWEVKRNALKYYRQKLKNQ